MKTKKTQIHQEILIKIQIHQQILIKNQIHQEVFNQEFIQTPTTQTRSRQRKFIP